MVITKYSSTSKIKAMVMLFLVLCCFFIGKSSSTVTIPNVSPLNCFTNEYFQFSSIRCVKCQVNQRRSTDMLSCTCLPGYKLLSDFGGPVIGCSKCQPPKVITFDFVNGLFQKRIVSMLGISFFLKLTPLDFQSIL